MSSHLIAYGGFRGQRLLDMARTGESAYGCVDGEAVVDLPATCIEGRSGAVGKTFSGFLDLQNGKLRVDCAEDPTMWLEIDLRNVPAFAAAPGGAASVAAGEEYREAAYKAKCASSDGEK